MKKLSALFLALCLCLSAAGALAQETPKSSLYFDEPLSFTWMLMETNFDLVDDAPTLKWIRDNLNVDIHLMAVPSSDYATKLSTLASTNSLPDVFFGDSSIIDSVADAGLLLNLSDYADLMPDYLSVIESEENREASAAYKRNGSYWGFQQVFYYRMGIAPLVDIRMDLLEKYGLEVPTTWDELYNVLLELKRNDPSNYVFSTRNGITYLLGNMAFSMGAGGYGATQNNYAVYYEPTTDRWTYGPAKAEFKNAVQWLANAYRDELMHPDYNIMDRSSMTAYLTSGTLSAVIDNTTFTSAYNAALSEIYPDAYFDALAPLQYDESIPARQITFSDNINGFNFISSQSERAADIVKFFNWLYTDEGRLLTNYGLEGESYYMKDDGTPCLLDEVSAIGDIATIRGKFGIGQYYIAMWIDQYTNIDMLDYESRTTGVTSINLTLAERIQAMKENGSLLVAKSAFPQFTAEELERLTTLETNLNTYFTANIDDFITGTRSMDEWETFVDSLRAMGVEEVETIYNAAYQRQK